MNDADLAVAADRNLAEAWALLGRAMGADVDEGPLTLVASGIPIPFFNGAYLRGPVTDPGALVAAAVDFFAQRNLPWLLWVRDGVSPALLEAGRAAGLRDAGGPPAMGLAPIPPRPLPPPDLHIDIVTTSEALADHGSLLGEAFEMPQSFVDRLIRPGLLDQPRIAVLVGRIADEPVSCSLLAISGTTAGVYNVATPARWRGKGYGAALTWAAVDEGARRGCTHSVLQASQAGYPVYRRMGYVDLGRYVHLEGPPPAG